MNDARRQELEERLHEVERELAEISASKTNMPCAPPGRQTELLIEQEAIELQLNELTESADF